MFAGVARVESPGKRQALLPFDFAGSELAGAKISQFNVYFKLHQILDDLAHSTQQLMEVLLVFLSFYFPVQALPFRLNGTVGRILHQQYFVKQVGHVEAQAIDRQQAGDRFLALYGEASTWV